MTKKKDVGVIIKFDDKEYSKEEMEYLYQRFFNLLAEAKRIKNPPQFIGKCMVKALYELSKNI